MRNVTKFVIILAKCMLMSQYFTAFLAECIDIAHIVLERNLHMSFFL